MKVSLRTESGKYEVLDCKFIEFKGDEIILTLLNEEKTTRLMSDIYYIVRHTF